MADWSHALTVTVEAARLSYSGTKDSVVGHALISGDARISDFSKVVETKESFEIDIQGRTVAEAKRSASVWPKLFDQIPEDGIGMSSKGDVGEQFHIFLTRETFNTIAHLLCRPGTTVTIFANQIPNSRSLVAYQFQISSSFENAERKL